MNQESDSREALLSTLNRFCCRFSTWNTSVPCSLLLSRSSQGACHLSYGALTHSRTSSTHCMRTEKHTNTPIKKKKKKERQKERSWSSSAVAQTFKQSGACKHTPTCTHFFSSQWAHSFLLQEHKSYQACCQWREWERNRGRARNRKWWHGFGCNATLVYFLSLVLLGPWVCVCVCIVYSWYYYRGGPETSAWVTVCLKFTRDRVERDVRSLLNSSSTSVALGLVCC